MASRLKEDEKNERIIRGLLKLPANRKCINCNSMGPQYVCTTFWTFVCTTCSGIHREFTHRVKSVSMAKFTSQEVSSLQSGGNERAKEIYFKELDSHRVPDSSNVDRLRDFIKHVYVDKRYTGGEKSNDRPPRAKMEETNDHRRTDSYGSGSRSPPYDDTFERRYSDRPSPGYEGRSPGYEQDRNSDYGRSPARSRQGIVNDWRREDRFGNGRRSEDVRSSDGDSKVGDRSPDSQKDLHVSSPSVVRPVRDILGENAPPLRVIEPPKVSLVPVIEPPKASSSISEGYPHAQRTASSSSLASTTGNGNPIELKREESLIDFDADPVPSAAAPNLPHKSSVAVTNTTSSDNWACFDNVPEKQVSQPPPNMNALDPAFAQLSVPSLAPSNSGITPATPGDPFFGPGPQVLVTHSSSIPLPNNSSGIAVGNFASFPSGGVPPAFPGLTPSLSANVVAGQLPNVQPKQQFASSFTGGPSNSQGFLSHPVAQVSQAGVVPTQASSGVTAPPVEGKTSGRKELPADLFATLYGPQPVHTMSWQTGYAPQMVYPMQYNPAMPMRTPLQSTKSVNPFDVSSESSYMQAPAFPSMMPLQAALPNVTNHSGLVRTSSLGTATPSWMPSQVHAYPSANPQLSQSFATTGAPPGTYMSHQTHSNLATRPQGFGGFGNDIASFNPMNSTFDLAGNTSAPAPPTSGNPFG